MFGSIAVQTNDLEFRFLDEHLEEIDLWLRAIKASFLLTPQYQGNFHPMGSTVMAATRTGYQTILFSDTRLAVMFKLRWC